MSESAQDEVITETQRIDEIIAQLDRALVLISVRLADDGPLYHSALVRIDKARRRLYLDELHPAEGHVLVTPGISLLAFVTLRGVAVRFTVPVVEILVEDGIALYACPYPEQLGYLQRREIFRVRLPLYERRRLMLQPGAGADPIEAVLFDLSIKGFGVNAPAEEIAAVPLGTQLCFTDLELPECSAPLAGEVVLVNRRPSPYPGQLLAGFELKTQDVLIERVLMRAALHYQREQRQIGSRIQRG